MLLVHNKQELWIKTKVSSHSETGFYSVQGVHILCHSLSQGSRNLMTFRERFKSNRPDEAWHCSRSHGVKRGRQSKLTCQFEILLSEDVLVAFVVVGPVSPFPLSARQTNSISKDSWFFSEVRRGKFCIICNSFLKSPFTVGMKRIPTDRGAIWTTDKKHYGFELFGNELWYGFSFGL